MEPPPQSFYRRPLPTPPCIAMSSEDGRAIFDKAYAEGGMGVFLNLIEHYLTQAEPAYCKYSYHL